MLALVGVAGVGVLTASTRDTSTSGHAPGAQPAVDVLDGTYREAVVVPGTLSLNPLLALATPGAADIGHLLNRSLLRLDSRAVPEVDLANSLAVSGDGRVYRFGFPPRLRWSDGAPITGSDVVATVAAVQQAGFPDANLAAAWKGVVAAVTADGAVTLTLPTPRASFDVVVAELPIVPAAVAARTPLEAGAPGEALPPPASGPFAIGHAGVSDVVLTPNPEAGSPPKLRSVDLRIVSTFDEGRRLLASGQVDGLQATDPSERAALADIPGIELHDTVTYRFVDLLMNTRRGPLGDIAVRRALASAIDRRALLATALGGQGQPQVDAMPAGIRWVAGTTSERPDPVLAARALDAAGWTMAPAATVRHRGANRLVFRLTVPDGGPLPAVARVVAAQLAPIGVEVSVMPVPASGFAAAVTNGADFDLAVADWDNGADPDISTYWRSDATPPVGDNVTGLPKDPFLDRALDRLATERDPVVRRDAAVEVDQHLAEQAPAVFLYAPETTLAVSTRISGVSVTPNGASASRWDAIAAWSR